MLWKNPKKLATQTSKGTTMSDEDVKATQDRGFECENMDPTFMTYPDDSFDFC